MYASVGAEKQWLSAAAAAGSTRFLRHFSPSPSSATSSYPRAWQSQGAVEVVERVRKRAPQSGMACAYTSTSSSSGIVISGNVHPPWLHAKCCAAWLPARAAHNGLLRPLSAFSGRVLRVSGSSAVLTAGGSTDERVEAALTDFILDGSKTTTIAHKVWQSIVQAGDIVIDATCGNGYDTLMLARLVLQEGTAGDVIGLDLQQSALDNTASLLNQELSPSQREKVNLLQLCHSQLDKVVDENSVRLVAFNLGYQPGGDKRVITQADTTVKAIGAAIKVLQREGLISIMSYVGHPGGREEYEAVRTFVAGLPANHWVCSHLEWINRPLCPHLMFLLRK